MRTAYSLMFCFLLTLGFAAPVWSQAAIGYGINAARAGAAGAAAGGGLAGVFSKLGRQADETTDSAATRAAYPSFEGSTSKSQATAIKLSKTDVRRAAGPRMPMKNGFSLSGAAAATSSEAVPAPAGSVAQVWEIARYTESDTAAPRQASPQAVPQGQTSGATAAPGPQQQASGPSEASAGAGFQNVIEGLSSQAQPATADEEPALAVQRTRETPAADELLHGIEPGQSVDEVIERFGRPYMALKGIFGESYSEKYIFKARDARVIVLALQGTITEVSL